MLMPWKRAANNQMLLLQLLQLLQKNLLQYFNQYC